MAILPRTSSRSGVKTLLPLRGTPLKTGTAVATVKVMNVRMMGRGAVLHCWKTLLPVRISPARAATTPSIASLQLATSGMAPANLQDATQVKPAIYLL